MFGNPAEQATQRLGKLNLNTLDTPIVEGEQVHALLFTSGSIVVPQGWI